jgi:hypothetical protein
MSLKKILLLLISSFFIISQSQSQGLYGTITDFTVNSTYLSPTGKIKLSGTTGTTTVKYSVTITRSINPSNQAPNPTDFNWYATNIGVGLGRYSGGYVWFNGSEVITNANFVPYQGTLVKEFTATIDNSQLISGSKIVLVYDVRIPGTPPESWVKSKYLSREYDFEYPVTTFYNDQKSQLLVKNNCSPVPEYAIDYLYVVNANKYSSVISKADANSKALLEITQSGQTAANTAGLCYVSMPTPRETFRLQNGYIENINWDASLSPGNQTVKIELLVQKSYFDITAGERFVLFKVLYENAPNTGQVVGGLNSSAINFPATGDYRVKITAVNGNVHYLSDQFMVERDN